MDASFVPRLAIGNQTARVALAPSEPFDYAVAQGFDAFEWFPDKHPGSGWDEADLSPALREEIRTTAHARGIRLSVHARLQANVFAPDGEILFRKDIDLARDLGARLLNVHLSHERGVRAFVAALPPLLRWTQEAGLALTIENTPQHSPGDFNEFFGELSRLADAPVGHVGMCFDLGHANLSPATRNDYLKFLDQLDQRVPIRHLHLHENWGDADTHLTLFTGPSARDDAGIRGFLRRLRGRGFSGLAILEQWPQPPVLLNTARDRLSQIWADLALRPGAAPSVDSAAGPARTIDIYLETAAPSAEPQPAPKTEGRDAPEPSTAADWIAEVVDTDRRCRSWREKLEAVRLLLARETPPLTSGQIVDLAIYLRFLATGEIQCAEDGRHFRPVHHARIAGQIRERLAQLSTPDNSFIVRRILPWLPSSAPAFQRAEPLTRIRDIAHRNDLPADLKREIKQSLQNKLHRCAGPEDLVVSAALLARLTAPGTDYSGDLVEQFRIFHGELEEFFNARSLDDQLAALIEGLPGEAELIRTFLGQKSAAGSARSPALLGTLTEMRRRFQARLHGRARDRAGPAANPRTDSGVTDRHASHAAWEAVMLADIALEDYAFVLLSEQINTFEHARPEAGWPAILETLGLAVENGSLSGIEPLESEAILAELRAWAVEDLSGRESRLRLKATVERARRLAEAQSERVIALFGVRAEKLGRALGLAEHAIRVLGEAEVRAHIVFQLSRLCSYGARRLRASLNQAGWDVLVAGRAAGLVRVVAGLDEARVSPAEPVVLLVRNAAGDEEIPEGVTGVVLAHELPHLSHLAVRARQAGVALAACEEPRLAAQLVAAGGRWIELRATVDGVSWQAAVRPLPDRAGRSPQPGAPAAGAQRGRPLVDIPPARLSDRRATIPLAEATVQNAGGKADGLRRLEELSRQPNALFKTAPAIVVPFGILEAALGSAPAGAADYQRLLSALSEPLAKGGGEADLETRLARWRALVAQLPVPEAIPMAAAAEFGSEARLMVRSSANCEDLETMAGAGLYDSVGNVAVGDVAGAVGKVWASLWTRRAARSRVQARIPPEAAHLAVIIQRMVVPRFAFVLHTANPVTGIRDEVYAEVVVGMGETLVGGVVRGNPYRCVCSKRSGVVQILAFANFSGALEPGSEGFIARVLDYSRVELSRDIGSLEALAKRLGAIGIAVEAAFGGAQDIEGVIAGNEIFLVQSRAQQGLC